MTPSQNPRHRHPEDPDAVALCWRRRLHALYAWVFMILGNLILIKRVGKSFLKYWFSPFRQHLATSVDSIMVGNDANNDRVEQLENSSKQVEETVKKSLQQITQTIATLMTHENEDQPIRDGSRRPNRGRGNGRHQNQHIKQHNYGGKDSDVEDEFEDGQDG
ncbi:hypothetical protein Tco_0396234 [Tanacetum coccineum]